MQLLAPFLLHGALLASRSRHQLALRPDTLLQQDPNISISRDQITPRHFVRSIWSYWTSACLLSPTGPQVARPLAHVHARVRESTTSGPKFNDPTCQLVIIRGVYDRIITILIVLGTPILNNRWKITVALPQRIRC